MYCVCVCVCVRNDWDEINMACLTEKGSKFGLKSDEMCRLQIMWNGLEAKSSMMSF